MWITILYQLKSWKYCFQTKMGGINYKISLLCGCTPRHILPNYIYIQHQMSRTCPQPRHSFAWILPLRNIIFPIIVDQQSWSIFKCSFLLKKNFMILFHGWGSSASRLEWEPRWGRSSLFTIKFPLEIAGTHFLSISVTNNTKTDPKIERSIGHG